MERNTWIFHKKEEPKLVTESEANELYKKGWADTPAAFKTPKQMGITEVSEEDAKLAVQGVVDRINGEANLDLMSMKELRDFAKDHLGKTYKVGTKKETILEDIKQEVGE